jgi:hypothetical protein
MAMLGKHGLSYFCLINCLTFSCNRFEDRSYFSDVPVTKNWKEVNKLLSSVWMLSNLEGVELTRNQVMSFLDVLKDAVVGEHRTKMALNTVKTYEGFMQVIARNGAAQATFDFKTKDWLKENGTSQLQLFNFKSQGSYNYFLSRSVSRSCLR